MIEPTDASKCDERQVKNKPKPLARKKKGETRKMLNQDMNSWKLTSLFVVSLMLMAGLFSGAASAELTYGNAGVSTTPRVLVDEDTANVRVTYTFKGDVALTATDTSAATRTTEIAIELPEGLTGATSVVTATPDPSNVAYTTVTLGRTALPDSTGTAVDLLEGDQDANPATDDIPILIGEASIAAAIAGTSGQTLTISLIVPDTAFDDHDDDGATPEVAPMAAINAFLRGKRITVTFYNAAVAVFSAADPTPAGMLAVPEGRAPATLMLDVDDDGTGTGMEMFDITVRPRQQSFVRVVQPAKKSGAVTNIEVTYRVEEAVKVDNTVSIDLPTGWAAAYAPYADPFDSTATAAFATDLLDADPMLVDNPATANVDETMASYVVLKTNVTRIGSGSPAATEGLAETADTVADGIDLAVTGPMARGNYFTVTFYNVRVPYLTEFDLVDGRVTKEYPVGGEDGIIAAGEFGISDTGITGSKYAGMLVAEPTALSTVDVKAKGQDSVEDGTMTDITVTYTATDTINIEDPVTTADPVGNENMIRIELPSLWEPAFRPQGSEVGDFAGFGDSALTEIPRTDRTTTSYVVYKTSSSLTDLTPTLSFAGFSVDVADMKAGDKITVTFYNVMVNEGVGSAAQDAQLYVTDLIVASNYDEDATIKVTPLKLGDVTVTKEVTAEKMVDLEVKYAATQTWAFGKITVELPQAWRDDNTIHDERQTDNRDATYVSVTPSRGVVLPKDATTGDSTALSVDGSNIISISVDAMRRSQTVTLTVHNLNISALTTPRPGRDMDIAATAKTDTVVVTVLSDMYATAAARDAGDPMKPPKTPKTLVAYDPATMMGSDEQPSVVVKRKALGALAVTPAEVTAGSEVDFTITYTTDEKMGATDAIEIKLPEGWAAPMPYGINAADKPADAMGPHIYLSGSTTRFAGTVVRVIDATGIDAYTLGGDPTGATAPMGWIVRVELGGEVPRNSNVVLKYNDATVQRHLTTDDDTASFEAFSGPSPSDTSLPEFPVKEQEKDIVKVKHAESGSGTVMFEFNATDVTSMSGTPSNTDVSIPAGVVKEDRLDLTVTYTPKGDMGTGQFDIRLPSGWASELVRSSGNEVSIDPSEKAVASGGTVTAKFPENFGQSDSDKVVISFLDVTVPNTHGDHAFVSRSRNVGGSLKQLNPRPSAFVGNTLADNDAVKVKITPAAAYENQANVDFEITLTANGPMHDSDIRITVPLGTTVAGALQMTTASNPNYVRMPRSSNGSAVDVDADEITVTTGKLNTDGDIRIRIDNVDVRDLSTVEDEGFRVHTRTRGSETTDADGNRVVDLSVVDYVQIRKDDGTRSIAGGLIRTKAGSGTMAAEPKTLEQGERSENFKLTFTAQTDFEKLNLEITVPSVIETVLQEERASGEGYVSSPNTAKLHEDDTKNDLVISGSTITWGKLTLKRGEKFVTDIKRVDIGEDTNTFTWEVALGGTPILAADEPKLIVVGTVEDDVVFEIVDESEIPDSTPSYPASSLQSIRFKFEADNTAIQPAGTLSFSVPSQWTRPSTTDRTGFATVAIVTRDADDDGKDDGEEKFVDAIPSEGAKKGEKMRLDAVGRNVTLTIGPKGGLGEGDSVIIRYGDSTDPKKYPVKISAEATEDSGTDESGLAIRGYFKVNDSAGFRRRAAGTIWAVITNVEDGTGTAELTANPPTTRAGSSKNEITVEFTGTGTMDGGAVRLTIPEDWGLMQDDSLKRNYIEVAPSSGAVLGDVEIVDDGLAVEVALTTFGQGDRVIFTYGGGDGDRATSRGAEAQADIGQAIFMVESMGSSDGGFVDIRDDDPAGVDDPDDPLKVEVKGAESGSGDGVVEIMATTAGAGLYDGETETMLQVHAGDDSTYLVFTYTPSQTIAEGQLRFSVPGGWSAPQGDATSQAGYTYLEEIGGAVVSNEEYSASAQTLTADVALTLGDQIKIHYGSGNGGAAAPSQAEYSQFAIAIRGTMDTGSGFQQIDSSDLVVRVRVQRSGGGTAEVSPMRVNAGNPMAAVTVTYTAEGEVDAGQLKLTIPAGWDAPMSSNITIVGGGANAVASYGGDHTAAELTMLAAAATDDVDLGAMDVLVSNVMLAGGGTVAFTYMGMAQGATGSAEFKLASDGGDGPGTGVIAIDTSPTVMVDEAAAGSGTVSVDTGGIVLLGDTDRTLTFTYTVAGETTYPSNIRILVPSGWDAPIPDNHTVTQTRASLTLGDVAERVPIGGAMVAQAVAGATVEAGDQIVFTYESATVPTTAGTSPFTVTFNGVTVDTVQVLVQAAAAAQLAIQAPTEISGDAGTAPNAITIMIQDAAGGAAASATAVTVNLVTSNPSTGSFSETADGDAVTMVTIPAGMSSKMVYYSDTKVGSTATIIASDASGGLDSATANIQVSTDVDAVSNVMVSPMVAKAGDTVTVSAMGTPGRTVMFSVDTMPATVTDRTMTETASGSYSGSFIIVADQHTDGDYTVTVNLNAESGTASLTIDSTAPTVSASASPATVGNGDMVTITAMATGATSVTADVSELDDTQTSVALTMGTNGTYSASVTISADNTAANGSKTITVTAMDAVGNSAMSTAMVTLDNKLSFTSTIEAATVLFHVPLNDADISTVGALKAELGTAVNLALVWDPAKGQGGDWESDTDDVMITAGLGIVLAMNAEASVTFEGDSWGGAAGTSTINLTAGTNVIGLPVNDSRVTNISDIAGLFPTGVVGSVLASDLNAVDGPTDPHDGPVAGDAGYLITATGPGTLALAGTGWSNGDAAAAPIALAGYNVDGQTPVLDVRGSVVDEITGLAKEGFRVKVKNLSTKAGRSDITSVETAEGYNMVFVDLKAGNAARVGDVLEISADSPSPLIGVKPVRHIVSVDDVKNSRIMLENLIAYEIPAETELLRNYPNPFNPETWIPYHLSEDADVRLTIYSINGEVVRDIDVGHQTAAKYDTRSKAIYWDGRNRFGEQVASGIYFYSLSAGDFSATRKMVILK